MSLVNLLSATPNDMGIKIDFSKNVDGSTCPKGSTASTNYTGQLMNGTIFDSSTIASFGHDTPFKFTVGVGMVIPCWDYAVQHMAPGDSAVVYCPSATAYGSRGAGGAIPPNADLIFKMQVISC